MSYQSIQPGTGTQRSRTAGGGRRGRTLWLGLAMALFASPAMAAEIVEVRVGRHPTFTRVVFELDRATGYRIERSHPEPGVSELVVSLDATSIPRTVRSSKTLIEQVAVQPSGRRSVARIKLSQDGLKLKEMILSSPPRIVLDVMSDRPVVAKKVTPPAPKPAPATTVAPSATASATAAATATAAAESARALEAEARQEAEAQARAAAQAEEQRLAEVERARAEAEAQARAEAERAEAELARAQAEAEARAEAERVAAVERAAAEAAEAEAEAARLQAEIEAELARAEAAAQQEAARAAEAASQLANEAADATGDAAADAMAAVDDAAEDAADAAAETASEGADEVADVLAGMAGEPSTSTPVEPEAAAESDSRPMVAKSDFDDDVPEAEGSSWFTRGIAAVVAVVLLIGGWLVVKRRQGTSEVDFENDDAFAPEEGASDGNPFAAATTESEADRMDAGAADEATMPAIRGKGATDAPAAGDEEKESESVVFDSSEDDMDVISRDAVNESLGDAMPPVGGVPEEFQRMMREMAQRVEALEGRCDELVDARDRLERQVAAQTEELRVQRAAIARTQRAVRNLARPEDEEQEATEPALRDPNAPSSSD